MRTAALKCEIRYSSPKQNHFGVGSLGQALWDDNAGAYYWDVIFFTSSGRASGQYLVVGSDLGQERRRDPRAGTKIRFLFLDGQRFSTSMSAESCVISYRYKNPGTASFFLKRLANPYCLVFVDVSLGIMNYELPFGTAAG